MLRAAFLPWRMLVANAPFQLLPTLVDRATFNLSKGRFDGGIARVR